MLFLELLASLILRHSSGSEVYSFECEAYADNGLEIWGKWAAKGELHLPSRPGAPPPLITCDRSESPVLQTGGDVTLLP